MKLPLRWAAALAAVTLLGAAVALAVPDRTPPRLTLGAAGVPAISPNFDGVRDLVAFAWSIDEKCRVTAVIYDSAGKARFIIMNNLLLTSGARTMKWDGRDRLGRAFPDGRYFLRFYVADVAGNRAASFPASTPVTVRCAPSLESVRARAKAFSPNGDGYLDAYRFSLFLPVPAQLGMEVRNAAGMSVFAKQFGLRRAGSFGSAWSGRDNAGAILSDGDYVVLLRAADPNDKYRAFVTGALTAQLRRDSVPLSALSLSSTSAFSPSAAVSGYPRGVTVSFKVSGQGITNLTYSDGTRSGFLRRGLSSGYRSLYWKGADEKGRELPDGTYLIRAVYSDRYGSLSRRFSIRLDRTPPAITGFLTTLDSWDPRSERTTISYDVGEQATVSLRLVGDAGEKHIFPNTTALGPRALSWDGRVSGIYQSAGTYRLRICAWDGCGNMSRDERSIRLAYRAELLLFLGVDTEFPSASLDSAGPHPPDPVDYTPTGGHVSAVMDDAFRGSVKDSFGNSPRFSWFVRLDPSLLYASGGYDWVYRQLMRWQEPISRYGDEIDLHIHNYEQDTSGATPVWNQRLTFNEPYFETSLAHMLMDCDTYPAVFRSGWTWEDEGMNAWLERWLPLDASSLAPLASVGYTSPVYNAFDWSRAPKSWLPYNPSIGDYQSPGDMRRYITRCLAFYDIVRSKELENAFALADNGFPALVGGYMHTYNNMQGIMNEYFLDLQEASARYPGVKYRFVTAGRGMQKAAGVTDVTPPRLAIRSTATDSYEIESSEAIFQLEPFVVARSTDGYVRRVSAEPLSGLKWRLSLAGVERLAAAVADRAGNVTTAFYPR